MKQGTLIYSPGVSVIIESASAGPVDVSADCSSGSLSLRENGAHNLSIQIENPNRKYDGLFVPNDRIVVQMKRIRWVQVFAGYIDSAPYFSTYARSINISAQCALKALRNWPWDRYSAQAIALVNESRDRTAQDGGLSEIVRRVITEVTNWPAERVHIGRVPEEWYAKFERIFQRLDDDITVNVEPIIGTNPIIAGSPFSLNAASPTGLGGGVPGTDAQLEAITVRDEDITVILANIRKMESGDNYTAINKGDGKGDWATGAYQFTDTTWGKFKGYARAYLAPRAVQDEKAAGSVRGLLATHGNKAMNVPLGWYLPAVFDDPSWLDRIPAGHEGNQLTLRQYSYKWLRSYVELYSKIKGSTPPGYSSAPITTSVSGTPAQPSGDIYYPIPAGVNRLFSATSAWGGYENGKIPTSGMDYNKVCGYGHPMAVKSFTEMAVAAAQAGFDISGSMYRSIEAQAKVGAMGAPAGQSNHGWGLACDLNVLLGNYSKKYPGFSNNQMYETDEYKWLMNNAYRWGWGHPIWGRKGGTKPEAWHWEFFAFENFKDGGTQQHQGVNPFSDGGAGTIGSFGNLTSDALFSALRLWSGISNEDLDLESSFLYGYKALMNDEPIIRAIEQLVKASGRSFCTAPNGDFISWWPDYWGEYGIAGAVDVEAIELKDFTVQWSDDSLITHSYVEGAAFANVAGQMPSGTFGIMGAHYSRGVATVDMPNLLASLLQVKDTGAYPWLVDPQLLLQRFGARVDRSKNSSIVGYHQEFFASVTKLTRAWAAMFQASAPLTFMPELYPGMLMRLPDFKVQMYVTGVTHSWNYSNGGGFTTDVQTMGISAMDGSGFYIFPKGGDRVTTRTTDNDPIPRS